MIDIYAYILIPNETAVIPQKKTGRSIPAKANKGSVFRLCLFYATGIPKWMQCAKQTLSAQAGIKPLFTL